MAAPWQSIGTMPVRSSDLIKLLVGNLPLADRPASPSPVSNAGGISGLGGRGNVAESRAPLGVSPLTNTVLRKSPLFLAAARGTFGDLVLGLLST